MQQVPWPLNTCCGMHLCVCAHAHTNIQIQTHTHKCKTIRLGWAWWCTPLITVPRRHNQTDIWEFKSRPVTERPCQIKRKKQKEGGKENWGPICFILMAKRFQSRLGQTFPQFVREGAPKVPECLGSQMSRSPLSERVLGLFLPLPCYSSTGADKALLQCNLFYFLVVLDTKSWALHMLGKQSLYHCATFLQHNKTWSEILRCESQVFFIYYKLLVSF